VELKDAVSTSSQSFALRKILVTDLEWFKLDLESKDIFLGGNKEGR